MRDSYLFFLRIRNQKSLKRKKKLLIKDINNNNERRQLAWGNEDWCYPFFSKIRTRAGDMQHLLYCSSLILRTKAQGIIKMKMGFVDESNMPVANLLKQDNNGFDCLHPFHHQTNYLFIYSFFLSPTIFSTLPTMHIHPTFSF